MTMEFEGVLIIDKPSGLTSSDVVQRVRRTLHVDKAGHTGTLDPMATGVLPLCLGRATALATLLTADHKRYRAMLKLGARTDSGDAEGKVIEEKPAPALEVGAVRALFSALLGKQQQVPPMVSAVKVDGKRLYELARKGVEVERKPREIEIRALDLVALSGDALEFDVHCSKGTYVRVLGEDIAGKLGTVGHLTALRRTASGAFTLEQAVALEGLDEQRARASLISMEEAVAALPRIELSGEEAKGIVHGRVPRRKIDGAAGIRTVFDERGSLLALAALDEGGKLTLSRVLARP